MAQVRSYEPKAVPLSGAIVAVVIAALAGFVVGRVIAGPSKKPSGPGTGAGSVKTHKVAGDVANKLATEGNPPTRGPATAKVTLVEFSDFQCPYCSQVVPTTHQLEQKYGERLRIVFRQNPLGFHDKARLAAEASLAAHAQGKFWEYHDKLFANQKALDRPDLERYAEQIGLDMARFREALDQHTFGPAVDADLALAAAAGVNGTPSFAINGQVFSGALPVGDFSKMIDRALAGQPIQPAGEGSRPQPQQGPRKSGLERADLERYAAKAGLDMGSFKAALDGHSYKARVDADLALARAAGASGTPTFLIGRQLVSGAKPFEAFATMIDAALRGEPTGDPKARDVPAEVLASLGVEGNPPAVGPAGATVTVVQFCDFECPYCRKAFPAMKQIRERYGDRVRIVFRQLPLDFHDKAGLAAEASLAAHAQGKFWQFYDALFEALTELSGNAGPAAGGGCGS